MRDKIAHWLRTLNTGLVSADNIFVEKALKCSYFLSIWIYRMMKRKLNVRENIVIIHNFDSNLKIKLDISRTMGSSIYWTGFHEFREMLFLHRFLKADMVLADVGANQGEFTLFAAKRLSEGKVLSFEPLPSIREALTENIEMNGFNNVSLFDIGLSDHEGIFSIYEFEGNNEGLATLYPGEKKIRNKIDIRLQTLDEVFASTGFFRLDFVKLDIEGGELAALRGAQKTIQKFKPLLLVEVNAESYQAAGYSAGEVLGFFRSLNYGSFEISKRGGLKPINTLPAYGNIIFRPE